MPNLSTELRKKYALLGYDDAQIAELESATLLELAQRIADGSSLLVPNWKFEPVLKVNRDIGPDYYSSHVPSFDKDWLSTPEGQEQFEFDRSGPKEIDFRPLLQEGGTLEMWVHRKQVAPTQPVEGQPHRPPSLTRTYEDIKRNNLHRCFLGLPVFDAMVKQWGIINFLTTFGMMAPVSWSSLIMDKAGFLRFPTLGTIGESEHGGAIRSVLRMEYRPMDLRLSPRHVAILDPTIPRPPELEALFVRV